jgi:hypothetical protein
MPALRDLTLKLDDCRNVIGDILCRLIHRTAEPCIIPKLIYLDLGLCSWRASFVCFVDPDTVAVKMESGLLTPFNTETLPSIPVPYLCMAQLYTFELAATSDADAPG